MPHKESKEGFLSVTEVLSLVINKPFLAYWRGKIGNELASQIQRESQELGVEVHRLIEERFRNGIASTSENSRAVDMEVNFFDKFTVPWEAKPLLLEESYEDNGLKLQGTLDAVLETNKGTYVVDFKTSNQLDKQSVPLQLSAYAHLSGQGVWKGLAVRIDKVSDKVDIKEYPNLEPYWPVFLKCLEVAQYLKWGIKGEMGE